MPKLFNRVAARLIAISERRSPDALIGDPENPYLSRWHLVRRYGLFNIYLHCFHRSDDDRALHDHPWPSLSIILRGAYFEITSAGKKYHGRGSVIFRRASTAHRLELLPPSFPFPDNKPWTLFITGPKIRDWGFHCPQGFVPWQKFTAPGAPGQIGKGCDQ